MQASGISFAFCAPSFTLFIIKWWRHKNQKIQLLAEYGFSIEDKKYETYFKFENTQNGLEMIS